TRRSSDLEARPRPSRWRTPGRLRRPPLGSLSRQRLYPGPALGDTIAQEGLGGLQELPGEGVAGGRGDAVGEAVEGVVELGGVVGRERGFELLEAAYSGVADRLGLGVEHLEDRDGSGTPFDADTTGAPKREGLRVREPL